MRKKSSLVINHDAFVQICIGMVIKLVSILIILNSFGCVSIHSQQLSKKLLAGTWAACIEGGLYVELHFSEENEYAYHVDNESLDYNVGKYIVCSEVVHIAIQEKALDCKQLQDVHQMKIDFKSVDEFENDDQGKKIVFRRLSNRPLMNYRKGTIALGKEGYMKGFKLRKDTFNCIQN